jgi:hypothetical protein
MVHVAGERRSVRARESGAPGPGLWFGCLCDIDGGKLSIHRTN